MACAHAPDQTPYAQTPNGHYKMVMEATTMAADDTELEEIEENFDDEDLIRYYFDKGFQCKGLCMFLERNHGQQMSPIIPRFPQARYYLRPLLLLPPPNL